MNVKFNVSCLMNIIVTSENNQQIGGCRVLRSATRKSPEKIKKLKCHLCHQRMEDYQIKRCKNYEECHGSFCMVCIRKRFKNRVRKERLKLDIDWICFICRGMCHCAKCKLELHNELLLLKQYNKEGKILYHIRKRCHC